MIGAALNSCSAVVGNVSIRLMLRAAFFLLLAVVAGCSAKVIELAAPLAEYSGNSELYRLEESVTLRASNAAPQALRAGTHWRRLGSIDYGDVFDTSDQVVIVNSFNVHEAAIVVSDRTVVGYYLVVAQAFVKVKPVPINLNKVE